MSYTPSVVLPKTPKVQQQKVEPMRCVIPKVNRSEFKQREPERVVQSVPVPPSPSVMKKQGKEVASPSAEVKAPITEEWSSDRVVPTSIAEEYSRVQELYYFPLEDARAELYNAYYDDSTAESTLAILAKRVANLTFALQNFWDRYHLAEDEEAGKTILPEEKSRLENVRKKYASLVKRNGEKKPREASSYTKAEIDEMIVTRSLPHHFMKLGLTAAYIKEQRIQRDIKYVRRNDRKGDKDYRPSLEEAVRELHEWEVPITEAMERSCALYGYTIPSDWVYRGPTEEELRQRHNATNRKSYNKRNAVAKELREAKKNEENKEQ